MFYICTCMSSTQLSALCLEKRYMNKIIIIIVDIILIIITITIA